MLRIFIGVDYRQPLAFTVLASSIYRHCTVPVAITPLILDTLPIDRRGTTDFTYSRYLVPWLCGYEGRAVFMDADCLVLRDLSGIFDGLDGCPVSVNPDVPRFERTAVMVFENALCAELTPEYIQYYEPAELDWCKQQMGSLDRTYHHLVHYQEAPEDHPHIVHFTAGIPEFKEVLPCDYAQEWYRDKNIANSSCSWLELMGKTVHADPILRRHLEP